MKSAAVNLRGSLFCALPDYAKKLTEKVIEKDDVSLIIFSYCLVLLKRLS